MAAPGRTPAIIIASLIIVFGIIHLGAGIGVCARYNQYQDVFRPSVGLSAFNIVIGIYAIVTGAVCLIAIIRERPALSKPGTICAGILVVFSIASFIAALVINAQAASYVRGHLAYRVDSYIEIGSSITIMNKIQTTYQCCGENSWLDWANVGLGITSGTAVTTNTGTNTGTTTGTVVTNRRRRQHLDLLLSPLFKAVRQRRQTATGTNIYGLPSTYTINLPLSCCTNAGVGISDTLGGYCVFTASNGTTGFYVDGCIPSVTNVMVLQVTGIVVINIFLAILSAAIIPIFMKMFPATFDANNPNTKQPLPMEMQQEQQFQNGQYYVTNPVPSGYYAYPEPAYVTYQ